MGNQEEREREQEKEEKLYFFFQKQYYLIGKWWRQNIRSANYINALQYLISIIPIINIFLIIAKHSELAEMVE